MNKQGIMIQKNNIQYVKCPSCKCQIAWISENVYRPFCSDRCQLIDLGAWAEQKYSVISESQEIPLDEFDDSDI